MKKLGIVGGMGTAAAAYLFQRLVNLTPAQKDQEHIETILHNNPHVPDRTEFLVNEKESPLPEIKRSINLLNSAGVDYIIIACMTAHYFIKTLQDYSITPIIDAIHQTAKYIADTYPQINKLGILATSGTISTNLFQNALKDLKLEAVLLNEQDQKKLCMDPIYADWGIKAGFTKGRPKEKLIEGANTLIKQGAQAIIIGCTELPIVLKSNDISVPLIDPIDIVVSSAIKKCFQKK